MRSQFVSMLIIKRGRAPGQEGSFHAFYAIQVEREPLRQCVAHDQKY
jgi:hypothetical protein